MIPEVKDHDIKAAKAIGVDPIAVRIMMAVRSYAGLMSQRDVVPIDGFKADYEFALSIKEVFDEMMLPSRADLKARAEEIGEFDAPQIAMHFGVTDYDLWSKVHGRLLEMAKEGDLEHDPGVEGEGERFWFNGGKR